MRLADEYGLIMETKVVKLLGITPIYLGQIKEKLNIPTIKVPRILKGQRCFDYKKIRLKHTFEIVDWIHQNRGV